MKSAASDVRIVFMGTPEFAVPSLNALVEAGYNIVSVATQPDRPRGRGHKMKPSSVKEAATALGLSIFPVEKVSSPEGIEALKALAPDFVVTVAFGQLLSQDVLDVPEYGCINVHASLLPQYRGASPILQAIMHGEEVTGISTMFTVKDLDAGPVLVQETTAIGKTETGGELTERLSKLGAHTLTVTLDKFLEGSIRPRLQDEEMVSYYPRFSKHFGEIDWSRLTKDIVNFVRALNPSPGAYIMLGDEKVGVLKASPVSCSDNSSAPGTILRANPTDGLVVRTVDGAVSLDVIRRAGGRAMSAKDSLRGRQIAPGGQLRNRGLI